MYADRSGSGWPAQPGLWNPVRWKEILPGERPQSGVRERFPRATGAIALRLLEKFSAAALPAGGPRRSKSNTASAKVLPAACLRKRRGNVLEEPKRRLGRAWKARPRNR